MQSLPCMPRAWAAAKPASTLAESTSTAGDTAYPTAFTSTSDTATGALSSSAPSGTGGVRSICRHRHHLRGVLQLVQRNDGWALRPVQVQGVRVLSSAARSSEPAATASADVAAELAPVTTARGTSGVYSICRERHELRGVLRLVQQ